MSIHGLCDRDEIHLAHEFHDGTGMWHCPGQHSKCRNCDDRKCMGCVFREYYHDCVDDCPNCCTEYVGRHRLGRNWCGRWMSNCAIGDLDFKVNLKGGAFHD